MSEFTSYDFSESVSGAEGFGRDDIESVLAAWGRNGDYAEWSGGFLLKLKDGRVAYIEGWCDTTGWGCQDGVETRFIKQVPEDLNTLLERFWNPNASEDWDRDPVDLNRLIRGEIKDLDE